jgi:hypothetical protein
VESGQYSNYERGKSTSGLLLCPTINISPSALLSRSLCIACSFCPSFCLSRSRPCLSKIEKTLHPPCHALAGRSAKRNRDSERSETQPLRPFQHPLLLPTCWNTVRFSTSLPANKDHCRHLGLLAAHADLTSPPFPGESTVPCRPSPTTAPQPRQRPHILARSNPLTASRTIRAPLETPSCGQIGPTATATAAATATLTATRITTSTRMTGCSPT